MRYIAPLVLLILSGCAVSTQTFVDHSYEDGLPTRTVKARSYTISPPFKNSQSVSDHALHMNEVDGEWSIQMGTQSDLTGGEMEQALGNLSLILGGI